MMAPRRRRSLALLVGGIFVLAALGLYLFVHSPWAQDLSSIQPTGGPKPGVPSIAWTPDHIDMDGDDTVSVTLTAQSPIPASQIEIVPSLAPYLSVSPTALPTLATGATRTLQIMAKVPAGTPLDTLDGTIHIRSGSSTIARPLPITLSTWVSFSDPDGLFSIEYPGNWVISSSPERLLLSSRPLGSLPNPETTDGICTISFETSSKNMDESLEQWLTRIETENGYPPPLSRRQIDVGSRVALEEVSGELGIVRSVYVQLSETAVLSTGLICGQDIESDGNSVFDMILKTIVTP